MDYVLIGLTALFVSLLTFFSGFGLGTLLMPAFAVFFPLDIAIAATAVVHLLNNVFKGAMMGRHAHRPTVLRFGLPAVVMAFAGAALLVKLTDLPALLTYGWLGHRFSITPLGLLIGLVILGFALLELLPRFQKLAFPASLLPLGGAVSGFFGGLSGHQGAFRSAFLIRAGLDKDAFIGTSVFVAVLVDLVRLSIYGAAYFGDAFSRSQTIWPYVLTATLSALLGSLLGKKALHKTTLAALHQVIGILLVLAGTALALGLI